MNDLLLRYSVYIRVFFVLNMMIQSQISFDICDVSRGMLQGFSY